MPSRLILAGPAPALLLGAAVLAVALVTVDSGEARPLTKAQYLARVHAKSVSRKIGFSC